MTRVAALVPSIHHLLDHGFRTIQVDGVPLRVLDVGSGPTLLFVHGAPAWSYTWRHVIAQLQADFRCIAPDLPGFGGSQARAPTPTARSSSAALEALVEALDLRDAVLVANDTGGVVGFGAAGRCPHRFQGLVAIDTFAFGLDAHLRIRVMLRLVTSAPLRWLNRHTRWLPRLVLGPGTPGRAIPAAERTTLLAPFTDPQRRDAPFAVLRSLIEDPEYLADVERGLEGLSDRPLLTLFGERDPARAAGFPEGFASRFRRCEHHVVANAAHFAQEDAPGPIAGHLRAWFARQFEAA